MFLSWDCIIKKKFLNLPGLQFNSRDRMSILSTPLPNGWTIPLMVLFSSCEIVNFKKYLPGLQFTYSGSYEPCLALPFKWPDNILKWALCVLYYYYEYFFLILLRSDWFLCIYECIMIFSLICFTVSPSFWNPKHRFCTSFLLKCYDFFDVFSNR